MVSQDPIWVCGGVRLELGSDLDQNLGGGWREVVGGQLWLELRPGSEIGVGVGTVA